MEEMKEMIDNEGSKYPITFLEQVLRIHDFKEE
jgi:hypothetical protein